MRATVQGVTVVVGFECEVEAAADEAGARGSACDAADGGAHVGVDVGNVVI